MLDNNQILDRSDAAVKPDAASLEQFFAAYGKHKHDVFSEPAPTPRQEEPAPRAPLTRSRSEPQPIPLRRRRPPAPREERLDWADWLCRLAMVGGAIAVVYVLLCGFSWSPLRDQPVGKPVQRLVAPQPKTMDIQDVRVGMRTMGKNPLREQVDPNAPEPNPETWRHLVIRMTKESGNRLDINLLRELLWIEAVGAVEGEPFFLDLPEMGAVGDAFVVSIGPCPEIKPGPGNVVTGTFHHEADPDTKILTVTFANGAYIKGVTDNHPFFSVDANDFVPVGEMHEGDYVKINGGITRLTKLESRFAYPGEMLYNLETHNEHVYQVTTAGILVHNNCLGDNMRKAGSFGDVGTDAHHIIAFSHRNSAPARSVLTKHGIDINDPINGVWLPRNSTASRARGALHREAGSALTNADYLNEVNRRILAADATGGRAHVLRELQKIRFDLVNGTFPGVRPNF